MLLYILPKRDVYLNAENKIIFGVNGARKPRTFKVSRYPVYTKFKTGKVHYRL